jgi:hypothetical protein
MAIQVHASHRNAAMPVSNPRTSESSRPSTIGCDRTGPRFDDTATMLSRSL